MPAFCHYSEKPLQIPFRPALAAKSPVCMRLSPHTTPPYEIAHPRLWQAADPERLQYTGSIAPMGPPSKISVPPVMGVPGPGGAPAGQAVPYAGPIMAAGQNIFSRIGFVFLVPFVFFLFSRLLDVTLPQLHLPLILGVLTLTAAFVSGEFWPALRLMPVRLLILFTVWFCLASIFGVWRGGSFVVFKDYWTKSFFIFLAVSSLAVTEGRIRLLIRIIAIGIAGAMLVALAIGATDRENRLIMPVGELANSNGLGILAVLGLPLCWHGASSSGRGKLMAIWSVVAALPMIWVVSRSGSRTALLMLGVLFLYALYQFDWRQRLLLAGIMAPLALVAFLTAPETLLTRYATLFVTSSRQLDEQASALDASAVSSTEARLHLLEKSLSITFRNPLLGIGPGNFMVEENKLAETEGRRGNWQVTHNGYTELSAETGVPGFLLYMAALVSIWRSLGKLVNRAAGVAAGDSIRHTATMFRILFFVTAIAIFFGVSLYHYFVPAFFGLALGFLRSADAAVGPAMAGFRTQ